MQMRAAAADHKPGRNPVGNAHPLVRLLGRPWLTVAVLWVVALLNYLDRLTITTMRDPIKAEIAMTDAQFGLLTSVFLWVYGFFSPVGGYLADRFSRRLVIISSVLVWSAVTALTGQMHSFGGLLAARALMGLSEACYIPAALALISDFHPGPTRSLATGIHMSGIYAGAALGGLGAILAEHVSWRFGFSVFGGFGMAYAVVCFVTLRDAPYANAVGTPPIAEALDLRRAVTTLLGRRMFVGLLVVNALVGAANWGIYGWLPTYLREHFQLGLGAAGMTATGYIQVASFAGVLIGGMWADRWSGRNIGGRALVPAIGFCVAGPALFLGFNAGGLWAAIIGLMIYGLGRGFFDANLMPILRETADQRTSATGYGILNFVSVAVGGVMIYAGGWLKDLRIDLGLIFQVSAAGLLLVGLILIGLGRAQRSPVNRNLSTR